MIVFPYIHVYDTSYGARFGTIIAHPKVMVKTDVSLGMNRLGNQEHKCFTNISCYVQPKFILFHFDVTWLFCEH